MDVPLAAACAPIYFFLFPKYNPQPDIPGLKKLAQIDWVGWILNAIVFTTFQIVLTFAGSTWKWDSAGPITVWIVFGVALLSYIVQQTFSIFTTPERRLYPVHFLKSRSMVLVYIGSATAATAVFSSLYYTPLFFQFTQGDSAIKAAVRLLPFVIINIFFIMLAGGLLPVVGRYSPFYILGGVFMIVGASLMHEVHVDTNTSNIYGYEVLLGVGAGLVLQIGYSIAATKVKPHDLQNAIGFMNVAQIGTIAISLSIAGSIFQNMGFINLRDALQGDGFSNGELRNALAGAQSEILMGGDPIVRAKAIAAIVKTMDTVWILTIVAGVVSVISGAAMKWEKLVFEIAAPA